VRDPQDGLSMIESGGEMVCTWFVLIPSLLPHPHTPPTVTALLIPSNLLTSENRNDNAADYPLVTPRYIMLHLCPSFPNDDLGEQSGDKIHWTDCLLVGFGTPYGLYGKADGRCD
jgi:hypothetical protein